jgi:hypothetical protein
MSNSIDRNAQEDDRRQATRRRLDWKDAIEVDTEMTLAPRCVGSFIARYTDDDLDGGSKYQLSAATIATGLGLSLGTVRGAIRTLKKRGWLVRRRGHFTLVHQNVGPTMRAYRRRRDEGRKDRKVIRAERRAEHREMCAELSRPLHVAYSNDNVADLAPRIRTQMAQRHGFVTLEDLQLLVDQFAKVLASCAAHPHPNGTAPRIRNAGRPATAC